MRTSWLIAAVLLAPGVARAELCKSYEWPTAGHPCFNAAAENDPPVHTGPLLFRVGFITRTFSDLLSDSAGSVTQRGETFMFKADGSGNDQATGAQMKLTGDLGAGFYIGGDLELASVDPSMASIKVLPGPEAQPPMITQAGAFMAAGDAVLGQSRRIDDSVELGIELASGMRGVGYSFDSRLGVNAG
ncbi:MAG TPA: hypothetical protein VGM39_23135, partial [Kofleriaceae bacterium]